MRRRGTREHAQRWACGVGPGHMAILRGWDTNETTGARAGGGVGPTREAGVGGTRGRRARMRVAVAGSVGRLTGWFDLWVQVMDQWIHHPR
jgi:hypothetical protein